jgi:uncharacterized protein YprB with RNaseH-like and TPR domain
MIRNTFSILSGIGEKKEKMLWREGIITWEDFLTASSVPFLPPAQKAFHDHLIATAAERLDAMDALYFKEFLKSRDHWRLFELFEGDAVCLDIETNGLPHWEGGYPTVVGLYDGHGYRAFIRGRDLTAERLMRALGGSKYLISFYGSVFDVPFLSRTLEGFTLEIPHFDLCFGARRLGFRGGLKKLEKHLGMERSEETTGLDGYDAVILWERSRRGREDALELLLRYNREDTVNLMDIARHVYRGLRASTGIEDYACAAHS